MNRLSLEKSPYLLQHAGNPVDWFPWGDEAFGKALAEDRIVLVSIGYSTCHWCHVMNRESFEDPVVAEGMNRNMVCVKVDREERPDIDREYMEVCHRLTGRGGWPLNVFLTPLGRPFFAATYIPKHGGYGRMGMLDLVPKLASLWRDSRDLVLRTADSLAEAMEAPPAPPLPDYAPEPGDASRRALSHFQRHFDAGYGGFYGAPKFPMAHNLRFLLSHAAHTGDTGIWLLVDRSLEKMRSGGIRDHLGYGFHRYSVDREWRLPHFEKMLYDQAMLALAYQEGGLVLGKKEYLSTARDTLEYVLRDLRAREGGFFSAEDADSEGGEGVFYTWRWRELEGIFPKEELDLAAGFWGLRPEGNYLPEAGEEGGRNLLASSEHGDGPPELETVRKRLWTAREKRPRPGRDEKILTDWNGLAIAALARCGACLREPRFVEAAAGAVDFILEGSSRRDGGLWHRWAQGEWAIPGFLDDYAFMVWGLIELYLATFEPSWLERALSLAEDSLERFGSSGSGVLAFSEGRDPRLGGRSPTGEDGPYPCGNGVMAHNLAFLGVLMGKEELTGRAGGIVRGFSPLLEKAPWAAPSLLDAQQFLEAVPVTVRLGGIDGTGGHPFLPALRASYSPSRVVYGIRGGSEERASGLFPEDVVHREGPPWAQVRRGGDRFPPVYDLKSLVHQLEVPEGGIQGAC